MPDNYNRDVSNLRRELDVKISIVIPVINEIGLVGEAVQRAWLSGADEVIVVDGGSSDGTWEMLQSMTCKLIQTEPGRAVQQNAGADSATSDVLLFLHVDTWLGEGGCNQVRQEFENSNGTKGGVFQQRIQNNRWVYRWIERGNAFRVRSQNLAYGDQAIFVLKSTFDQLGQFPLVPLMEDFMFSQRFKQKIGSFKILPGPLHVDARRWERFGPVRQTLRNWMIATKFRLGVSPSDLVSSYRRHDKP